MARHFRIHQAEPRSGAIFMRFAFCHGRPFGISARRTSDQVQYSWEDDEFVIKANGWIIIDLLLLLMMMILLIKKKHKCGNERNRTYMYMGIFFPFDVLFRRTSDQVQYSWEDDEFVIKANGWIIIDLLLLLMMMILLIKKKHKCGNERNRTYMYMGIFFPFDVLFRKKIGWMPRMGLEPTSSGL